MTTTARAALNAEQDSLRNQMEALLIRTSPSLAPVVPAENRAAYDALFARYAEVDAELRRIASAEAYSVDNDAALTGCYNEALREIPALDSLSEGE